jgi:hypothetical protein
MPLVRVYPDRSVVICARSPDDPIMPAQTAEE